MTDIFIRNEKESVISSLFAIGSVEETSGGVLYVESIEDVDGEGEYVVGRVFMGAGEGMVFKDMHEYLASTGFKYLCSDRFGTSFPDMNIRDFVGFHAMYVKNA